MEIKRAYSGGRFALDMESNGDSIDGGWLISAEGGMATSDVVQEKFGPDSLIQKHVSQPKYEDITIVAGPTMSGHFYKWMDKSFNGGSTPGDYVRLTGAIIAADYNFKEKSRLSFYEALASELTLPGCDAASAEKATFTVKITPEYTRWQVKNDVSIVERPRPIDPRLAKNWLLRNFKVEIDGLDCTRVNKFDPILIKQKNVEVPLGEFRDPHREPVSIEYPGISLMVPESQIGTFLDWYNDFVIAGKCDGNEKNGAITYLSESTLKAVCQLDLYGLGIFKLTPDKGESGSEKIRYVKVDMYCERMRIDTGVKFETKDR